MKTLNTLTSNDQNFEKKVMYAYNTQFGIETGSREEWLNDDRAIPGAIRFMSKHIDMYPGTQKDRQLYIRNVIIDKLESLGLVYGTKMKYLKCDKLITL
jgi:hypothetical protein